MSKLLIYSQNHFLLINMYISKQCLECVILKKKWMLEIDSKLVCMSFLVFFFFLVIEKYRWIGSQGLTKPKVGLKLREHLQRCDKSYFYDVSLVYLVDFSFISKKFPWILEFNWWKVQYVISEIKYVHFSYFHLSLGDLFWFLGISKDSC